MEGIVPLPPGDGVFEPAENELRLPKLEKRCVRKLPFGTARYYTMRSVYRGKDEKRKRALELEKHCTDIVKPDSKEVMDVNLPRLELKVDCRSADETKVGESATFKHGGYIQKHKSYFRIKGLQFEQVYSIHRNRAERAMIEKNTFEKAKKYEAQKKKPKTDHFHLPPIDQKLKIPQNRMSYRTSSSSSDEGDKTSDVSPWERRVVEMIHGYTLESEVSKRSAQRGRKLGGIVSSRRLQQLLDGPFGLAADQFYDNQR